MKARIVSLVLIVGALLGVAFGCSNSSNEQPHALLAAQGAPSNILGALPTARCVVTALPGTYSGSGSGVLTSTTGSGAIAAQNGVTLVANDLVLLAGGATNEHSDGGATAMVDSGPWIVTNVGSTGDAAGNYYQLTRPTWWAHGSVIPYGATISIGGEDTLFGGSTWHVYAAKGALVDANDPIMYPDGVGQQVTLVAGLKAITNVPLRSAAKTVVVPTLEAAGGSVDASAGYQPFIVTPGYLGTASVTVKAVKGLTTNTNDTSTVNVRITN